jgi:hypothetical protein
MVKNFADPHFAIHTTILFSVMRLSKLLNELCFPTKQSDADKDESDWFLLDYQKKQGLPAAIVAHIKAGIHAAAEDPKSLLIFSGGETRAQTGPETEGASYYRIADAMNLWPSSSGLRARTITEEFARDSFENL